MSLSDRRRYPRFPFHSRAQMQVDVREFKGTLMDISLSGALFAVDQPPGFSPGTECRLVIHHRRQHAAEGMRGTIVYCADHLIGIKFLEVDGAAENDLRLMIDMNLALPQLLKRDLPALLR